MGVGRPGGVRDVVDTCRADRELAGGGGDAVHVEQELLRDVGTVDRAVIGRRRWCTGRVAEGEVAGLEAIRLPLGEDRRQRGNLRRHEAVQLGDLESDLSECDVVALVDQRVARGPALMAACVSALAMAVMARAEAGTSSWCAHVGGTDPQRGEVPLGPHRGRPSCVGLVVERDSACAG